MKAHRIRPKAWREPTYYRRLWLEVQNDGEDAVYAARDGSFEEGKGMTYVFLRVIDMVAACGREADFRWAGDVSVVELLNIEPETAQSAFRSMGEEYVDYLKVLAETDQETVWFEMACALHMHGARAELLSNSAGKLPYDYDPWALSDMRRSFGECRLELAEFGEEILRDEALRNHLMDTTVVNRIGQTARSAMRGTGALWEHLIGLKNSETPLTPDQEIILKIYGSCEHTLGAGPIPAELRNKETV